jgi:hypothetical protein
MKLLLFFFTAVAADKGRDFVHSISANTFNFKVTLQNSLLLIFCLSLNHFVMEITVVKDLKRVSSIYYLQLMK